VGRDGPATMARMAVMLARSPGRRPHGRCPLGLEVEVRAPPFETPARAAISSSLAAAKPFSRTPASAAVDDLAGRLGLCGGGISDAWIHRPWPS
jgi:hypothetical protein